MTAAAVLLQEIGDDTFALSRFTVQAARTPTTPVPRIAGIGRVLGAREQPRFRPRVSRPAAAARESADGVDVRADVRPAARSAACARGHVGDGAPVPERDARPRAVLARGHGAADEHGRARSSVGCRRRARPSAHCSRRRAARWPRRCSATRGCRSRKSRSGSASATCRVLAGVRAGTACRRARIAARRNGTAAVPESRYDRWHACRHSHHERLRMITIRPMDDDDFPRFWPTYRAIVAAQETYAFDAAPTQERRAHQARCAVARGSPKRAAWSQPVLPEGERRRPRRSREQLRLHGERGRAWPRRRAPDVRALATGRTRARFPRDAVQLGGVDQRSGGRAVAEAGI